MVINEEMTFDEQKVICSYSIEGSCWPWSYCFFQDFNIKQRRSKSSGLIVFYFSAVDCGPINAPTNGSVTGNKTIFPNSAQFGCDSGFILRGSKVRNCQANGSWDGIETLCNGK